MSPHVDQAAAGRRHLRDLVIAIVAVIVLALLAGCGSTPPRMVTVKVPVPVECREPVPERPAMPTDSLTRADPLDTKVKAALAEIELREGYEIKLVAALVACTRPIDSNELKESHHD